MNKKNKAWEQYEAGLEYKRRIGLYENNRRNERFYRGDQWYGSAADNLPKPVFNVIRRVIDFLVCSISSTDVVLRYTDENLPYMTDPHEIKTIRDGLEVLAKNTAYRWEKDRMDGKINRLLGDAAVSGDGVIYCYWDPDIKGPQGFRGDIVTEVIDNVNLFVSDVNRADIQSQDYIILSSRASVSSLRREAMKHGVSAEQALKITADRIYDRQSGDLGSAELEGEEEQKTTYIIKFWKEDGKVVFEKSTSECVIKRVYTDCRLYPVAYFNWYPTKNSFHGTSPITALIPNQKFINRAYALVMKHMTDTAFSKVVYDKSRIPEWSNEVGEAIAAQGGGNISDAVSVLGVGDMQSGYMELINNAISVTKELMGATDSALGNIDAKNTSAILALQETSKISLEQIRDSYYRCIEDMGDIWADMICAYYPSERLLPYSSEGEITVGRVDLKSMKQGMLCARIDVAPVARYTAVGAQNMLDKLLDGGYISASAYVRRLPAGIIHDREALIDEIEDKAKESAENGRELDDNN
ncbi:MAG: hypothetical protein E7679_02860 [Ruminococcaceae bacterium]|nr:hypothetical protein [Oscillospiraceae bacterium]